MWFESLRLSFPSHQWVQNAVLEEYPTVYIRPSSRMNTSLYKYRLRDKGQIQDFRLEVGGQYYMYNEEHL